MSSQRPATLAQVYRLNRLKALKLVEPGAGEEITMRPQTPCCTPPPKQDYGNRGTHDHRDA